MEAKRLFIEILCTARFRFMHGDEPPQDFFFRSREWGALRKRNQSSKIEGDCHQFAEAMCPPSLVDDLSASLSAHSNGYLFLLGFVERKKIYGGSRQRKVHD